MRVEKPTRMADEDGLDLAVGVGTGARLMYGGGRVTFERGR